MKNKIDDIINPELESTQDKKINRKEAIRKAGFVALSAATMMMLVGSPNTAQAASAGPPNPGNWGTPGLG
jgi:hypothetical protein